MEIKQIIVGKLQTNCYLFVSESELAVIDPGDEASKILEEIKKTAAEVKYIINTHYHYDHILADKEIKEATGAKILVHKAEKNFLVLEPDRFLLDREEIKIGKETLEVIHTPGHSQGSICLLGNGFLFSGDTIFIEGYGRIDFPGGSADEMERSLAKLTRILKPGMTVYPGHGEIFKA